MKMMIMKIVDCFSLIENNIIGIKGMVSTFCNIKQLKNYKIKDNLKFEIKLRDCECNICISTIETLFIN